MLTAAAIEEVLNEYADPETGRPMGSLGQVGAIGVDGDSATIEVGLTTWAAPIADEVLAGITERVAKRLSVDPAQLTVTSIPHERKAEKLGQVGVTAKSVIAVGSGKGGVGKSTIATSIAYGLKKMGSTVGLMDADIYGPSVPHLVGVNERPTAIDQRLQPIEKDGLKLMSMGFMVPAAEAVVWRGPMLHGAVTQMLRDTDWGQLDYLVIDMPPGTGDIALTLSQLLPLTGSVVVCTPQDVALLDAVKAIAMFKKVNIPVLGVVENMSYFLCPDNGLRYDIFGNGGAKAKAKELGVPFIGEAPISIDVRKRGDDGQTSGNYADEYIAPFFEAITRQMVRNIADSHAAAPAAPSLPVL
ncbi:MAG: Mrp/NBP35 family ATP-binding protein [Planctomycetota bacterium]